jgi:hypothetical protein
MITQKNDPLKPDMSARDGAGSMNFEHGTGSILNMCNIGDFLEIYKKDATLRVKSPESIDPERTNPNAPWTTTLFPNVGCSNPIVARLVIQSEEILKQAIFIQSVNKVEILQQLHKIKELLLTCESIASKVLSEEKRIIEDIKTRGITKDNHGRALNPFPHIPNLDIDAENFLIQANKIVRMLCLLPKSLIELKKTDTNFDHLAKTLQNALPIDSNVTAYVIANADGIRRVVHLRNYSEHPGEIATAIKNFEVMPNGSIRVPAWGFATEELRSISNDMAAIVEFLLRITEGMFLHLVRENLKPDFNPIFIKEESINPDCPILYTLTFDLNSWFAAKHGLTNQKQDVPLADNG